MLHATCKFSPTLTNIRLERMSSNFVVFQISVVHPRKLLLNKSKKVVVMEFANKNGCKGYSIRIMQYIMPCTELIALLEQIDGHLCMGVCSRLLVPFIDCFIEVYQSLLNGLLILC